MTNEQLNMDREIVVGIVNQNQIILGQLGQILAINVGILERALNPLMVVPDPYAGQAMDKPSGHFCAHGKPIEAWCTDCDIEKVAEACRHGIKPGGICRDCLKDQTLADDDEPAEG